jgi:multiple sugar transport system ATP-binding protein
MAEVELRNVDKVYDGGVHAVQNLTLEVEGGELLVLVGPSGCGKTTALRMVAGLETITDGTISIGERVVNDLTPKERDVAMVFQNYALYPHLSVADNIAFGLLLRRSRSGSWRSALLGRRGSSSTSPRSTRRPPGDAQTAAATASCCEGRSVRPVSGSKK